MTQTNQTTRGISQLRYPLHHNATATTSARCRLIYERATAHALPYLALFCVDVLGAVHRLCDIILGYP